METQTTVDKLTTKEQLRNSLYLKAVENSRMDFFSFVQFVIDRHSLEFVAGSSFLLFVPTVPYIQLFVVLYINSNNNNPSTNF